LLQGTSPGVDTGEVQVLRQFGRANRLTQPHEREDVEIRIAEVVARERRPERIHVQQVRAPQQEPEQVLIEQSVLRCGIASRGDIGRARIRDRIAAGDKQQWSLLRPVESQHLADQDDVVAAVVNELRAALEPGAAATQQRRFVHSML